MVIKSYQDQAEQLLKEYALADPVMPYVSIIGGIFACKMVYDLTQLISSVHFKSYSSLSKIQRTEWNNRLSDMYPATDLYSDDQLAGLVTLQSSPLSTFVLGVSVGYFLTDLGMIFWFYPDLGGLEYVVHHLLSIVSLAYAMLTGEVQLYTYMVLISETTTPGINLRWYLDTVGMKRSRAYVINGVVIFLSWLVARILLFIYLFYHVYLHYDQGWSAHLYDNVEEVRNFNFLNWVDFLNTVAHNIPNCTESQTDSVVRTVFSNRGAIGVSCDELDVVCKDFQGTEEDISKEAVIDTSR
ncbi:TRAM/LAG1/CLN8 domain containing protein [Trema orientale]|uniref:TRAM/LAG1/CLN8 domain containing protein n=1 Tax=Trema orientale TaxID=63057 RepID=A0A2P5EVX8_TREOI|nr:TRAM/LAG1/CLN8 domain containing protein [Trema orientale]